MWHLLGGPASGYWPEYVRLADGMTHWYLRDPGRILDPTLQQFGPDDELPNYSAGVPCGFLTKRPSARARELMDRILWKNP